MPTLVNIRKKKMVSFRFYRRALFLIASVIFLGISQEIFAKTVNLKTKHVTLSTPLGILHAEIHFDTRDQEAALIVEEIIKKDLIKVVNYFEHVPASTVHFNLNPYLRLSNGNARVFPTTIINLYQFPASQREHLITLEDWLTGLVFHEFIHITHLDQTSDYLKIGENIFGSIAKVPASVVPRWFTEGIAVWGESHLIKGGRLNNPLFKAELVERLSTDEKFCKTIDCLDEPGVYPGGAFSYWAGAHFLEYLENTKSGTIKCLVKDNSGKIPFLLNRVFEKCTGLEAPVQFELFKESLVQKYRADLKSSESQIFNGEVIKESFGVTDHQRGFLSDGEILIRVEKNRLREALVAYDLDESGVVIKNIFPEPINNLVEIFKLKDEDGDLEKIILASFTKDLDFREENKAWSLINGSTLTVEKNLLFAHDPSYVLFSEMNAKNQMVFLTASYLSNRWVLERQTLSNQGKSIEAVRLHSFGHEVNLVMMKKSKGQILLKLHQRNLGSALYKSDLELSQFDKIFESGDFYDVPLFYENIVIVRHLDKIWFFDLQRKLKTEIKSSLFLQITEGVAFDESIVFHKNGVRRQKIDLSQFFSLISHNTTAKSVPFELLPVQFSSEQNLGLVSENELENYPQLYHLKPHYWFIATGTSDNLSSLGVMTTFSDPMGENTIEATLLAYPEVTELGGRVTASSKVSIWSDLLSVIGVFGREYGKSEFSSVVSETTEGVLGARYLFLLKKWSLSPTLYAGMSDVMDFLSSHKKTIYGINSQLIYDAFSYDDFLQNVGVDLKIQNDIPQLGDSFLNLQARLLADFRLDDRIILSNKFSFGKLTKNNFSQGVIYGGGSSSYGTDHYHDFYGIPYSNAYGNEIYTGRMLFDLTLYHLYRGFEFIPVFGKELHFLAGIDYLKSNRIILDNQFYIDESIQSFFIGPKMKLNLFYYVPSDLDIIFSKVTKPNGGSVSSIEINIKADLL